MQLHDFRSTRARIQPYLRMTPTVPCDVPGLWLKLENLQHTHSFKIRGAFARVLQLVDAGDRRRILAVSAGNHGLAVARAASTFNKECTVVVPQSAPKAKIEAIRKYGVDLQIRGANYDEAEAIALEMAKDSETYAFVSPYNDPGVILGQGSLAFEILEQVPDVETIVVSIGGGGLIAGIATAARLLRPSIRVVGVQTEVSAAMYESLKAGHMVTVPDKPSIADGIQGNIALDTMTFPLIQENVDEVVLVTEEAIRRAMDHLLYTEKLVVEGSAAASFAAVSEGIVTGTGPIVTVICGGNLDLRGKI